MREPRLLDHSPDTCEVAQRMQRYCCTAVRFDIRQQDQRPSLHDATMATTTTTMAAMAAAALAATVSVYCVSA